MRQATTILVLEDDPMIAGMFCTILRRQGYDVLETHNAHEALEVLAAHPEPVKLLVCDVVLAYDSGPSAVSELRKASGPLSVLYVSGLPLDLLLERALLTERDLREPNTFYRQKPFTPNDLVADVHRILGLAVESRSAEPQARPGRLSAGPDRMFRSEQAGSIRFMARGAVMP